MKKNSSTIVPLWSLCNLIHTWKMWSYYFCMINISTIQGLCHLANIWMFVLHAVYISKLQPQYVAISASKQGFFHMANLCIFLFWMVLNSITPCIKTTAPTFCTTNLPARLVSHEKIIELMFQCSLYFT